MTSDDPVMTALAEANPVSRVARPDSNERAEAERVLQRVLSAPTSSRHPRPFIALTASAVVVAAVVVVALTVHRSGSGHGAPGASRGAQITLQPQPGAETQFITGAAMSREIQILRERLTTILHGLDVRASGIDQVLITASSMTPAARARAVALATQPGRLYLYDWEANALTPNGKTVASQLPSQDATAIAISQGTTSAAPGDANAGGMPLYQAVKLAAAQPKSVSAHNTRLGRQYYMFGAAGSAACAAAAREHGLAVVAGQDCLLAGPDDELSSGQLFRRGVEEHSTPYATAVKHLESQLPKGVNASQGQVLVVQQGTVVLEAANPNAGQTPPSIYSPSAQFFVLRDNVAVWGSEVTNPRRSTDTSGNPDVSFGFDSRGNAAFQHVTAQIAHRGQNVSTLGNTYDQHFAVALDNQLLTVPSIDFRQYPDGIIGASGADITAGFTTRSAQDVATELRYGPLPLALRVLP